MNDIVMFHPYISKEAIEEVNDTLKTRWIGQGPKVDQFEREFGKVMGVQYPVAVNSGTAALFLAYYLMDIKPGDEVITPVLTCTATNIPLLQMRAKIVFADIDKNTLNINLEDVMKKVNRKTKCIVNVHLSGNKSDLPNLGIPMISDSSQYHEPPLPNDTFTTYSFQAIKHITTGDGGMLVCYNKKQYERAKRLRWFGIDREAKRRADWSVYKGREITTDIAEAGWKLQMTDIAAAIGLGNLKNYDKIMHYHDALSELYWQHLSDVPGLQIVGGTWSYPILVEKRERLMRKLMRNGIESNMVQVRNDIVSIFGGKKQNLPNMNEVEDKYLYLPLHMYVTEDDVERVCEVIRGGW